MTDRDEVVVFGGTAGTGELVVRRLVEAGTPVRVAARSPEKAARLFGDSVEIVRADVTEPGTLAGAVRGARDLVYTVGIPRRIASGRAIRETVYHGTLDTLRAAEEDGLPGRFVYMSALGTTRASLLGSMLNLIKGDTLKRRGEVEAAIRASQLTHTIVHAGILRDRTQPKRAVRIAQEEYPLRPRYQIARSDVADVFVRALGSPATANTTFDAVWGWQGEEPPVDAQFAALTPD